MWKLSQPTIELIKWYKSEMLSGLRNRISSTDKLSAEVKSVFISNEIGDNNLIKLLTATPQKSFILNNWLWRKISAIYNGLHEEEKASKLKEIKSNLLEFSIMKTKSVKRKGDLTISLTVWVLLHVLIAIDIIPSQPFQGQKQPHPEK